MLQTPAERIRALYEVLKMHCGQEQKLDGAVEVKLTTGMAKFEIKGEEFQLCLEIWGDGAYELDWLDDGAGVQECAFEYWWREYGARLLDGGEQPVQAVRAS